jgi:lambda family phage portal protein
MINTVKRYFRNRAEKRAFMRAMSRAFQGATFNRLTSDWMASFLSQDAEIRYVLRILRNRSRELGRNNDYVRAFFRAVQKNIVGRGVSLQPQVKDDKGELNPKINADILREWSHWTRKENCHVSGTLSFRAIERLAARSAAESGEIIVRFIFEKFGRSKIPLGLQIIEADLLDENFNGNFGSNRVKMGVELDRWDRPVAYHFFTCHPGDTSFPQEQKDQERVRIPAEEIVHLFIAERPIQTRGFPWIASAMLTQHQLGGFIDGSVVRKRAQASIMGFITTPEPDDGKPNTDGYDRVEDFSPGKFSYLAPGETVTVPNFGNGSESEFDPFVRAMIRKTASGIGSSYEEISKDWSQSNYSSSRLALLSERDDWRILQDWMIEHFHQPIFEKWLELAVMSGVIKIPGYFSEPDRFNGAKWRARGWDWVDPMKDVTADLMALGGCLRTYSDILGEDGKDFEETMQQIKRERDRMKELGLDPDLMASKQKPTQQPINEDMNENPEKTASNSQG